MLPFLKPKSVAGLIISKRKPDGSQAPAENESASDDSLEACAEHLIQAINSKDAKSVASALRSAFAVLESEAPTEQDPDFAQE